MRKKKSDSSTSSGESAGSGKDSRGRIKVLLKGKTGKVPQGYSNTGTVISDSGIMTTLDRTYGKHPRFVAIDSNKPIVIGHRFPSKSSKGGRIFDPRGISPPVRFGHWEAMPFIPDSGASGTATTTSGASRPTTRTSKRIGHQLTLRMSKLNPYQILNSYVRVFLAKPFPLRGRGRALRIQGVRSFLRFVESLKLKDPSFYYSRTSRVFFPTKEVGLSQLSSTPFKNWGIGLNGKCLTARILESHRTGRGCSLSDILEKDVDEKYFLSERAMKNIFERKKAHPNIRWKSGIRGEGAVPFPDKIDRPSRTITRAESGQSRMTHVIKVEEE